MQEGHYPESGLLYFRLVNSYLHKAPPEGKDDHNRCQNTLKYELGLPGARIIDIEVYIIPQEISRSKIVERPHAIEENFHQ